jgi:vancomycin resistance protein VanJ
VRWVGLLLAGYAVALLVQTVLHVVAPQRDGLLAIVQVGAPHLFLPLAVLLPIALALGQRRVVLLLLLAAVVGAARFGPGMVSLPAGPAAPEATWRVATWNLAAGEASAADLIGRLLESDVEIIALPELTPAHAAAIEESASLRERFPYRLLAPHPSVLGMGMLSAHPATELQRSRQPPHILAEIELPDGVTVVTMAAHPLPPRFELLAGVLSLGYQAAGRDHDLAHLRSMLDHHLVAGRAVLVLADLNVTDREPAYADFSAGLVDAHRAAGVGPGSTWRPMRLSALPLGILRIDYVLTGGPLRPIAVSTECSALTGDHCILWATVAVD